MTCLLLVLLCLAVVETFHVSTGHVRLLSSVTRRQESFEDLKPIVLEKMASFPKLKLPKHKQFVRLVKDCDKGKRGDVVIVSKAYMLNILEPKRLAVRLHPNEPTPDVPNKALDAMVNLTYARGFSKQLTDCPIYYYVAANDAGLLTQPIPMEDIPKILLTMPELQGYENYILDSYSFGYHGLVKYQLDESGMPLKKMVKKYPVNGTINELGVYRAQAKIHHLLRKDTFFDIYVHRLLN